MKYGPTAVLLIFFLIVFGASLRADSAVEISRDLLDRRDSISLIGCWKYQDGDDTLWADPNFDDSGWRQIDTANVALVPDNEWAGYGWFRIHLQVDSSLQGRKVALKTLLFGAGEIYLNGRLVDNIGEFGKSKESSQDQHWTLMPPVEITLDTTAQQVLAIRFSNFLPASGFHKTGFLMVIKDLKAGFSDYIRRYTVGRNHQMFFTGMALAFFIIAILMYIYPPRTKQNLLFVFVTLGITGLCYFPNQMGVAADAQTVFWLFNLFKISIILACLFGLWFLYSLFYERLPRQFWILLGLAVILTFGIVYVYYQIIYAVALLFLAESARVVVWSVYKRKHYARMIGLGFLLFILAASYQMLGDMGIIILFQQEYYWYYLYGVFALLVCDAIYLAQKFSQTTLDLANQLDQVRQLSAKTIEQEKRAREQELKEEFLQKEIEYQKKELEEAHKLEKALADLETANREIRATQSQLVQSEKMASMGMLVAGVAHEINTPIGAICSMHDTLMRAADKLNNEIENSCERDCLKKANLVKYLGVIRDANKVIDNGAERVSTIVKRLRSFARLDQAELKDADINEGLEDTLVLVHHELKHDIEVDKNYGRLPLIACYPGELNQVFLNLIINARQAIKGKGRITITTRHENDLVIIEIADTGSGIKPEHLDHIFDPGFTTKGVGVGTGLGLSICYQIIQTHKGDIKVESTLGQGTKFTISLPVNLNKLPDKK